MLQKIKTVINLIISLLLISIFAVFFINNSIDVELNLSPLNYIIEVKLFVLIIISFILGFLFSFFTDFLDGVFSFFGNIKNNRIRKLKEKIKLLKIKNREKKEI